jgi:1-acyl-sn-glycerol-3-phosphate acyltransferase
MIFPEGTRYSDGRIHPYKKGGFVLSVDSGVPIVPVILHGTDKIMPKGTLRVMEGEVLMELLTPVETAHYTRKTKDRLLERIHDLMREAFEKNKGSH